MPMLVADYTSGVLCGRRPKLTATVSGSEFSALLGKGHLVITIDQGADMDRYQGVTPADGASLAEAAVGYFAQSEQIPTAIKLSGGRISSPGNGERWRAGGIMTQYVPDAKAANVRRRGANELMKRRKPGRRIEAFVASTQADELLDPGIGAETLLFRLFHDDNVRVFDAAAGARGLRL